MERKTITLANVIDEMNSGRQFDIEFVTCDEKRRTGGELKAYSGVIRSNTPKSPSGGLAAPDKRTVKTKQPNHRYNSTVNLYIPREEKKNRFRKVHLRLITLFNGKEVL